MYCKRTYRAGCGSAIIKPLKTFLLNATVSNTYVLPRTTFNYIHRKTYDNVLLRQLIDVNEINTDKDYFKTTITKEEILEVYPGLVSRPDTTIIILYA